MAQSHEEKDRLYLQENDAFLRFLHGLYHKRETALASLADADDVQMRKLSGQITILTDILNEFGYDDIRNRRTG